LFARELRALLRHLAVGIEAHDQFDQQAFSAATWHDCRAGTAALKQRLTRINLEVALAAAMTVTLETTFFEDGLIFWLKLTG